jgi:hypothetical protein
MLRMEKKAVQYSLSLVVLGSCDVVSAGVLVGWGACSTWDLTGNGLKAGSLVMSLC